MVDVRISSSISFSSNSSCFCGVTVSTAPSQRRQSLEPSKPRVVVGGVVSGQPHNNGDETDRQEPGSSTGGGSRHGLDGSFFLEESANPKEGDIDILRRILVGGEGRHMPLASRLPPLLLSFLSTLIPSSSVGR